MKYLFFICVIMLQACTLNVGDFPEERQRLYNNGERKANFCQEHPDRCIDGVPW